MGSSFPLPFPPEAQAGGTGPLAGMLWKRPCRRLWVMANELTCPHCHKRLTLGRPQPEQPIHCPTCAGLVPVPWAHAELAEETPEPTVAPWWRDHPDQKPNYGPPMRMVVPRWYQRVHRRVLTTASATLLVLAAGTVWGLWPSSESASPELETPLPAPAAVPLVLAEIALIQPAPLEQAVPVEVDPGAELVQEMPIAPVLAPLSEVRPAPLPPPAPPAPPRLVVKRLNRLSDEDLRKQLLNVPEIKLDQQTMSLLQQRGHGQRSHLFAYHRELQGLPWQMGADCQLGKEPAETMQAISRQMREILAKASNNSNPTPTPRPAVGGARTAALLAARTPVLGDVRLDPALLRNEISSIYEKLGSHREAAVPCLMQMLQPENSPVREILLEQLAKINHPKSTEALVKLALFDLDSKVREEALRELAQRPRDDYRQQLLEGFRHPWPVVAERAAEALVALQDKEALPALLSMAEEPDRPSNTHYDAARKTWVVSELVRVNHLKNCLLCHAPSQSSNDLVRGRIPSPTQPLPPLVQYYQDTSGTFVRADITYLRQDFSIYQPVDQPGPWPTMQRFDYMVRKRPETMQEAYRRQRASNATTEITALSTQRRALLFALHELSQN